MIDLANITAIEIKELIKDKEELIVYFNLDDNEGVDLPCDNRVLLDPNPLIDNLEEDEGTYETMLDLESLRRDLMDMEDDEKITIGYYIMASGLVKHYNDKF